jgi:hypothetical protein
MISFFLFQVEVRDRRRGNPTSIHIVMWLRPSRFKKSLILPFNLRLGNSASVAAKFFIFVLALEEHIRKFSQILNGLFISNISLFPLNALTQLVISLLGS